MNYAFDFDQAQQHIFNLFPEPWPGGIIIEAASEPTKEQRYIKFSHLLQKPQDFQQIPEHTLRAHLVAGHNFYFTCGYVDGRKDGDKKYFKRTINNVTHLGFLWADVDDINGEQADQIAAGCPCRPTGYVRSGGGYHFYWLLQSITDSQDKRLVEALKRLEVWTGGDRIAKVNQILGLPGTVKFKPWKYEEGRNIYIQEWDNRLRYDLDEILSHKITPKEIRLDQEFVKKHIVEGQPFSDGDRSTRDFAIIKELIKAKHTREEILKIFQNAAFLCSEKVMGPNGEGYFGYTYSNALAQVKTSTEGCGVTDDGKVAIRRNVDSKGNIVEDIVSNFVVVPQELHVYDNENYGLILNTICGDMSKKCNAHSKTLANSYNFRAAAGIPALSWMGTEKDFQQYVSYIRAQITDDHKFPATTVAGWFQDKVITDNYQLGDGPQVRYWNKGAAPKVVLTDEDSINFSEFMQEVYEHLRLLNTSRVAFHSFGWFAAALFAPQIRESLNRQFPLLCLSGEPGSGKTTTAITLNKALCGVVSDYSYQGSHAALRRVFSSTNCFPIFMDEYEASVRSTEIDAYLRYSWQGGVVPKCSSNKGNWDTVEDLPLIAPICIGTVTAITDDALRDRLLYIRVRASERPRDPKGINWFRMIPPGYFARNWFKEPVQEIIEQIKHCIAAYELQYPDSTDRQAIAEGVALGVLQYCNKKYWGGRWDWKTARNAEIEEIISVQKETPETMVDAMIAFMLRNPGVSQILPDFSWRTDFDDKTGNEVINIHQRQLYDKAPYCAKLLQLPPYISERWLKEKIGDLFREGKVLKRSHSCRLNKGSSGVACIRLDLTHFPITKEAAHEISENRGVLNLRP